MIRVLSRDYYIYIYISLSATQECNRDISVRCGVENVRTIYPYTTAHCGFLTIVACPLSVTMATISNFLH